MPKYPPIHRYEKLFANIAILYVLYKIAVYEMVSGLQLNLSKCEFLAVNCDDAMIDRLIVYRIRFRENVNRYPTVRMMMLTLIIEMQKLICLSLEHINHCQ